MHYFGLLTRIDVAVQIPILLSAIIFFNNFTGLFTAGSEFSLQIPVLGLLIFYFFYGAGKWSMDYYMANHKDKWEGTPSDL